MKIKSLLLGSAAALVAVTGARAADAVMAEPEPVEYVRVCDAYGVGFFYIPGTETCLRISGYVWYQIQSHSFNGGLETTPYYGGVVDSFNKNVRARLNFDARSDTEWGTLRGFIRLQSTFPSGIGDGPVTVDQGFIELGGLRMGYTESAWAQTQGGGASNWGSHSWGGMYYGYQQRHLIAYTFTGGNGFFATLSLEDDAATGEGYMPDVVFKAGVNQGWGSVWAMVAYDESFDGTVNAFPGTINDGGFAAALGMQFNIPNMPGSSLRLIGYYADGDHAYNVGAPGNGLLPPFGGAEWSILASYNHQFSSTLGASIAFQYFNDLYWIGSDVNTGTDAWGAELSIVWFPVTNFEVRTEIHYDDLGTNPAGFDSDGTVSGFLRFTRYF